MKLLLPREHGAYGQLLLPLVTGLVLWGTPRPSSYLLCLTALGLFWSHEPLLILLGHRGSRQRRVLGRRAWLMFSLLLGVALGSLLGSWQLLPSSERMHLGWPLGLGLLVLPWLWSKQEKTSSAELLVAVALSAWVVPVLLSKGVGLSRALALWLSFAGLFAVAVLAVRGLLHKVSLGWSLGAAVLTLLGAVLGGEAELLPKDLAWPLVPTLLMALGLSLARPGPQRLRQIGWLIVATTVVQTTLLALRL
jgi:hypothetical protein